MTRILWGALLFFDEYGIMLKNVIFYMLWPIYDLIYGHLSSPSFPRDPCITDNIVLVHHIIHVECCRRDASMLTV